MVKRIKGSTDRNELEENSIEYNDVDINYKKFKKFLLYGKSFLPFFISHHPECLYFKGHTIGSKKVKLCIGCFVGYPAAIISIFIINIIQLHEIISLGFIFFLSMILMSTFTLSLLNLTKNKIIKIIQKGFIGVGASFLIYWIMFLPNAPRINFIISFITLNLLITIFNLYHVYGIIRICYKCEYSFNWGICPGFISIRSRMERYKLPNFLLKMAAFSDRILHRKIAGKK